MRLNDKYYALPGGSVGQHFVDALIKLLALGQHPTERYLMFSSIVL